MGRDTNTPQIVVAMLLLCATMMFILVVTLPAVRKAEAQTETILMNVGEVCEQQGGVLETNKSDVMFYRCMKGKEMLFNGVVKG